MKHEAKTLGKAAELGAQIQPCWEGEHTLNTGGPGRDNEDQVRDGDTGRKQAGEEPGTKTRTDRKEVKQKECTYETTGSKRRNAN